LILIVRKLGYLIRVIREIRGRFNPCFIAAPLP